MKTATNKEQARANEIWCDNTGMSVCVTERCMGSTMFSEIGNNIRQGKTWNGGFRYTAEEREYMKNILINELEEPNPTCECGRVAF
jgi:hypothetical protein